MAEITAIDRYITHLFGPRYDLALFAEIERSAEDGGLPQINISVSEGQLLHVLAKAIGAKRILEIGTLGGFSGTWLASALPAGGKLVTLEINETHAEVARRNFETAGLTDRIDLRVGPASETLKTLVNSGEPSFDLAFIDADKDGYEDYLAFCLKLVRKGGLILGDNTLSHGVLEGNTVGGIGRYNAAIAKEAKLTSTIVPTMRDSLDGLSISVVE